MVNIPIIGETTEQKLVITFKKQPNGEGGVTFHFEPDIREAVSPEQRAALNVANQIINLFNLNREGEQNAESTREQQ